MLPVWCYNVLAHALQTIVLVAGSAVLMKLFRLRVPAVRLACLQTVLVVCLILPFLQTWKVPAAPSAVDIKSAGSVGGADSQGTIAGGVQSYRFSFVDAIPVILGGGIAIRMAWLLLGFCSLYVYRRRGSPWREMPALIAEFQKRSGVRADFKICEKISSPITFGFRAPVIALPPTFSAMKRETQRAIACHELIHVRRHDWLFTVMEEFVAAALWFNPAVWWLVSQIRLAREEVVDLEVIQVTGSRDGYLEALLDAAGMSEKSRLAPATLFLWRGQLVKRIAGIVNASEISRRRLISAAVAGLAAMLILARVVAIFFPLVSEARTQEQSAAPIQVERGSENLVHRASLEYPGWVIERRIEGLVTVDVTIDDRGGVSDAHVVSGPQELRRPVLWSVLQWQYDPKTQPAGNLQIIIQFHLPAQGVEPRAYTLDAWPPEQGGATGEVEISGRRFRFQGALDQEGIAQLLLNTKAAERGELAGKLVAIGLHGQAEAPEVRSRLTLPIQIGDTVDADSILRVEKFVEDIDKRLMVGLEKTPSGDITLQVLSRR